MKLCSYRVVTDSGLAPNPFWGFCTLALCTPNHQNSSVAKGDWIIGTRGGEESSRLVYAMCVTDKLTLDQYFKDPRFAKKIPVKDAPDLESYCGDNIYRKVNEGYQRIPGANEHLTEDARRKDLRLDWPNSKGGDSTPVFVSDRFFYFGGNAIAIPEKFRALVWRRQGTRGTGQARFSESLIADFVSWMESNWTPGLHGLPRDARRPPAHGAIARSRGRPTTAGRCG